MHLHLSSGCSTGQKREFGWHEPVEALSAAGNEVQLKLASWIGIRLLGL